MTSREGVKPRRKKPPPPQPSVCSFSRLRVFAWKEVFLIPGLCPLIPENPIQPNPPLEGEGTF